MAATLATEPGVVLFLGDSLTAGLGVDPDLAFPALIQRHIEAAGLQFRAVNAGNSGETSAGGLRRVQWLLRQRVEVLVLELGANDGLRGTDLESTRVNLQGIIDATRARYPDVEIILAGMQVPPNLGAEYTSAFRSLYPQLAEANKTHLIPFLLAGVAGDSELNQPDGIHPTAEGHVILATNVWAVLEPVLRTLTRASLPAIRQDKWTAADAATIRLPPAAFPELPAMIIEQLDARGCSVPQVDELTIRHNVTSGDFLAAGEKAWAILCSVDQVSSILVFSTATKLVAELNRKPDRDYLQGMGGQRIGYSRLVNCASPSYIRSHYDAAERELADLPLSIHDGIDDGFEGKASTILYFTGDQWIELPGAN